MFLILFRSFWVISAPGDLILRVFLPYSYFFSGWVANFSSRFPYSWEPEKSSNSFWKSEILPVFDDGGTWKLREASSELRTSTPCTLAAPAWPSTAIAILGCARANFFTAISE